MLTVIFRSFLSSLLEGASLSYRDVDVLAVLIPPSGVFAGRVTAAKTRPGAKLVPGDGKDPLKSSSSRRWMSCYRGIPQIYSGLARRVIAGATPGMLEHRGIGSIIWPKWKSSVNTN